MLSLEEELGLPSVDLRVRITSTGDRFLAPWKTFYCENCPKVHGSEDRDFPVTESFLR
jgi:hypothetical protein